MPRQPRLDLPGFAQHIVQRGNDRQPCFYSTSDYQRYKQDLREIAMAEDCAVHAYVLMTNHVHLLLTPRRAGSVSRLMQSLGRRYVRYVNDSLIVALIDLSVAGASPPRFPCPGLDAGAFFSDTPRKAATTW